MQTPEELHQFLPRHIRKLLKATSELPMSTTKEGVLNLESSVSLWGSVGNEEQYNLRPDSQALKLRELLAGYSQIPVEQICIGNGSTELIDLVMRTFCTPNQDNILCFSPSDSKVKHFAKMNALEIIELPITPELDLPIYDVRKAITENTKIIFIENPNHITGTCFANFDMVDLATDFDGIVVIDESAIDYTVANSLVSMVKTCSNVIVVQSFSRAWGLAGLPIGVAYAQAEIIKILQLLKPPFSVNIAAQRAATKALYVADQRDRVITRTIEQRAQLTAALEKFPVVKKIHPSQTNTLLVQVENAAELTAYFLEEEHIVVLNVSDMPGFENCIRINIGQPLDNVRLLNAFKDMPYKTSSVRLFWKAVSGTLRQASTYLGFFKKIFGA